MVKLIDVNHNKRIKIVKYKIINDHIIRLMEFGLIIGREFMIINQFLSNLVIRLNGSYYSIPYELAKLIYVIESW